VAVNQNSKNTGLNSIVRKVSIMENTQHTKKEKEPESKVDTLEGLTKSKLVAVTETKESKNLSQTMTATMQNASRKTWNNAELEALKSKAGLVAGALADFQAAGGLVAVKSVNYKSNNTELTATKIILVVEGHNLVAVDTEDGLDFDLVAVES